MVSLAQGFRTVRAQLLGRALTLEVPEPDYDPSGGFQVRLLHAITLLRSPNLVVPIGLELPELKVVWMSVPERTVHEHGDLPAGKGQIRLPRKPPNIMQLLLEGKLGAPQVDLEVHTLGSAGTGARDTYRAASLGAVARDEANPHRAVRELYEPEHADQLVRRVLDFLNKRTAQIPS